MRAEHEEEVAGGFSQGFHKMQSTGRNWKVYQYFHLTEWHGTETKSCNVFPNVYKPLANCCSVQNILSSRFPFKCSKIQLYSFIILPVVLYWVWKLTYTMRDEHRLRVCEKMVLRNILLLLLLLNYLLTYLLTCLLALIVLLALLASLARLLAFSLACSLACLLACLLACFLQFSFHSVAVVLILVQTTQIIYINETIQKHSTRNTNHSKYKYTY